MTGSRRITSAVVLLAALVAAAALVTVGLRGSAPAPSHAEQAQTIAAGLRCPVCKDLSAADSPAPLARQMRRQIRSDLEAGRTPEQIRARFVAAYGPSVLMAPPDHGVGVVVNALPVVVPVTAALVGMVLLRRWLTRDPLPSGGAAAPARSEEHARRAAGRVSHSEPAGNPPRGPGRRPRRRLALGLGLAVAGSVAVSATLVAAAEPDPRRAPAAPTQAAGVQPGQRQAGAALSAAVSRVRKHPRDLRAHLDLARTYAAVGEKRLAAIEYLAVAKVQPDNAEANTALAMMAFVAGAPEEAHRIVNRVLRTHPRYPEALYTRGLVRMMGLHDRRAARADLRAYLQAAPLGSHRTTVQTLLAMTSTTTSPEEPKR